MLRGLRKTGEAVSKLEDHEIVNDEEIKKIHQLTSISSNLFDIFDSIALLGDCSDSTALSSQSSGPASLAVSNC